MMNLWDIVSKKEKMSWLWDVGEDENVEAPVLHEVCPECGRNSALVWHHLGWQCQEKGCVLNPDGTIDRRSTDDLSEGWQKNHSLQNEVSDAFGESFDSNFDWVTKGAGRVIIYTNRPGRLIGQNGKIVSVASQKLRRGKIYIRHYNRV